MSVEDARKIAQGREFDIFNIKIMKLGGLHPAMNVALIAESAGIPCMVGSMPELNIATMAGVHFALAMSHVTFECELIGPLMVNRDIAEGIFFSVTDAGKVAVASDQPGLGLTLLPEIENHMSL
jgi:L-alanine-DL-glutamate epimerase-like enolase superfamily enzyme